MTGAWSLHPPSPPPWLQNEPGSNASLLSLITRMCELYLLVLNAAGSAKRQIFWFSSCCDSSSSPSPAPCVRYTPRRSFTHTVLSKYSPHSCCFADVSWSYRSSCRSPEERLDENSERTHRSILQRFLRSLNSWNSCGGAAGVRLLLLDAGNTGAQ